MKMKIKIARGYHALFPEEFIEHDLHVIPVSSDGLATLICQADQRAEEAVDILIREHLPPKIVRIQHRIILQSHPSGWRDFPLHCLAS